LQKAKPQFLHPSYKNIITAKQLLYDPRYNYDIYNNCKQ